MSKSRDGWTRCDGRRVTCPICGKDWCTISPDQALVCCMRAESDWPVKNGGFIHRLKDSTRVAPPVWRHTPVEPTGQFDQSVQRFSQMFHRWQMSTDLRELSCHAQELGVTVESLSRIGIAWAGPHRAWAFAMRDDEGRIIGIRLRAENGDKWAVIGSRQGLFWPSGQVLEALPVLITEGPTDCAAALDLGFFALGRAACRGLEQLLGRMLRGRDVVILADRDEAKQRPDGTAWYPGREGAEALAAELFGRCRTVKIIYPAKGKDIRAWLRAGCTHDVLRIRIEQAHVWTPKQERQ